MNEVWLVWEEWPWDEHAELVAVAGSQELGVKFGLNKMFKTFNLTTAESQGAWKVVDDENCSRIRTEWHANYEVTVITVEREKVLQEADGV